MREKELVHKAASETQNPFNPSNPLSFYLKFSIQNPIFAWLKPEVDSLAGPATEIATKKLSEYLTGLWHRLN
jgi:hypothetical protein